MSTPFSKVKCPYCFKKLEIYLVKSHKGLFNCIGCKGEFRSWIEVTEKIKIQKVKNE